MTVQAISFLTFLLLFLGVGIASARKRQSTTEDYLVASRKVHPWLAALSSVATNNSGFMFIGLAGFTYRAGIQGVWLQVGWVIGDYLAWQFVHGPVREISGRLDANSVPALLSRDGKGNARRLTAIITAVLTLFFLGGYAAAQLKAGATTLHSLFGWDMSVGAILGAVLVAAYCFSGGIRASIWTDAVQSVVMLISLLVLIGVAAWQVGGPTEVAAQLERIDPELVMLAPTGASFGVALYLLGFVAGGLGAIGQPHILIRSMSIKSTADIKRARRVYFLWFIPFSILAVSVGLYARILLPDLMSTTTAAGVAATAENALPEMSQRLLPDLLVGLSLAGVFAATLSTADSQLLSCSAAINQDLFPRWRDSYTASKIGTLSLTGVALMIALTAREGVFELVLTAWSALGATIGPLIILRVLGIVPSNRTSAAMIVVGLATVFGWRAAGLSGGVYEVLPGMLLPILLYGGLRLTGIEGERAVSSAS
ncbi:MAG: sodium/proline symporter [Myxococcales bacterium]|nr:sodium/proline symporter [Myxococcales bacterium]